MAVVDPNTWYLTLVALDGVSEELHRRSTYGQTFDDLVINGDEVIICSSHAGALVAVPLYALLEAAEKGLALEPTGDD